MYIFTDPRVVGCLYKVITTFAKVGEHLYLVASPSSLKFSVSNSSLTVLGKASFSTPLFTGRGASKSVHIKARAADFVFRRLENEDITLLQMNFCITKTGQEQLEMQLDYASGIKKVFRIACLQTATLPIDFEPVGQHACTFECSPSVLKDAFASCEAGADELKVGFQSSMVNLLARRKGAQKTSTSVLQSGLRTIINLQPETFRQITVKVPRQLEFKLKEFRVMLSFFDQLGEEIIISAKFRDRSTTTPLVFDGGFIAFPGVDLQFKFMSKISIPRTGADNSSILKVGVQPSWVLGNSDGALPRASEGRAVHADPAIRLARQERERRMRSLAALNSSTASLEDNHSATPSPIPEDTHNLSQEEVDPEVSEVGLTQGHAPTSVRGLFD